MVWNPSGRTMTYGISRNLNLRPRGRCNRKPEHREGFKNIGVISESVEVKIAGWWKDVRGFETHDYIRVIDPGRR